MNPNLYILIHMKRLKNYKRDNEISSVTCYSHYIFIAHFFFKTKSNIVIKCNNFEVW